MNGVYGGLIMILLYGVGVNTVEPETNDFLLLDGTPFLLLDLTNFLLL